MSGPRLTSLAQGGGCGCKLAPEVLRQILAGQDPGGPFANLMVGRETSDDAAVWRLNADQALVATTDFFTPIVDDPRDFGAIAATNALSDVYAMGGRPFLALAIVGMPIAKLDTATIAAILAGGAEVCAKAGVALAGGHSIDSAEPIYGLAALGLAPPGKVLTNAGGRAGDALILTKPLGVGVLSAALKQSRLDAAGYAAMIAVTTRLNTLGAELHGLANALTDVTGFGLIGHALEMARGAGLTVEIEAAAVPTIAGVEALLRAGVRTGASDRNWASCAEAIDVIGQLETWRRDLLTDPQTSGGLLIAASDDNIERVMDRARRTGFTEARVVGRLRSGPPRVCVKED